MSEAEIIDVVRQAIMLMIQISTPVMVIGLVVGVVIALLQALTQVQEMTLVFVPKILAIYISIFALFPGMVGLMITFMHSLTDRMIAIK